MYDHQLYVRALAEFTRVLLTPYDVHRVLGELVEQVTGVLALSGAGVSLVRDGRLEFDTDADAVGELERVQEQVQVGPCVTAFETGEVIAVSDLGTAPDRWPDYCAAAARVGIIAVASIPMRLDEQSVGTLNLYADRRREWPDEDLAASVVMTNMATVYMINASHLRKQAELAEQLQHALDSRVIIEQAKGVLIARHGLAPDEAFHRIRRYARNHNVTVTGVSDAIVRLNLDP